jgi:hypothetical protein
MQWAFNIQPHAEELLSGYLCRVALAHGATPFGFLSLHLGDTAFWARDVDRGTARYETRLSEYSGLSLQSIHAMTLGSWMNALRADRYKPEGSVAVTPWINSLGIYHRTRRLHGLLFCPHCLESVGSVQKRWRLSFMVLCPQHVCPLLDACPRCDAPFVPHRATTRGYWCHSCHLNLAQGELGASEQTGGYDDLMRLQRLMYQNLVAGKGLGEEHIDSLELRGLRDLISVLLTGRRAEWTMSELGVAGGPHHPGHGRLETTRLRTRVIAMKACAQLVEGWPKSFRAVAAKLHLTQSCFQPITPMPVWLSTEVDALPKGATRTAGRHRARLEQRISSLSQRQPENWRALRANLLCKAARHIR